ncbi:hypothetical protein OU798_10740 [Prolixibacteraceae bacterium Z1-6]|uniref:Uncharacterized protein n=1 Tax=Draconibacterium aestuarii TaxID=2998507 RepID=A0A9X3J5V8_9BACT|nr:hypothetical protein [Prolixibacteraceae bacterium Z1-6]
MDNKYAALIYTFFLLVSLNGKAQDIHDHEHEHIHDDHKTELGIANSLVYFTGESQLCYGLHVHLVRNIGHSKFSAGLGYERIFDEHKHNTVGIVGMYTPIERLHFSLSPGIAFEGAHPSEKNFAIHFETTYEFQVGDVHMGPLLELAHDSEDYHISLGVHIGLGFK